MNWVGFRGSQRFRFPSIVASSRLSGQHRLPDTQPCVHDDWRCWIHGMEWKCRSASPDDLLYGCELLFLHPDDWPCHALLETIQWKHHGDIFHDRWEGHTLSCTSFYLHYFLSVRPSVCPSVRPSDRHTDRHTNRRTSIEERDRDRLLEKSFNARRRNRQQRQKFIFTWSPWLFICSWTFSFPIAVLCH